MSVTPESRCFVIRKRAHFCLKLKACGANLKGTVTAGECNLCVPDKGDHVSFLFPTHKIPKSTQTSTMGVSHFGFRPLQSDLGLRWFACYRRAPTSSLLISLARWYQRAEKSYILMMHLFIYSRSVQPGAFVPIRGHSAMCLESLLVVTTWRVLVASSG